MNYAVVLAVGLGLVGCTGKTESPTSENPSHGGLIVTDALNRVVSLQRIPQRISISGKASFMIEDAVYLFSEARENNVMFLGGQYAQRAEAGDFLSLITPDHAESATLSGEAGTEQIAAGRPDVVLMKSSAAAKGTVMEQVSIPVVYLDFETPAQYERDLSILGSLLNAPVSAGELVDYYRHIVSTVQERTASTPDTEKPRGLLLQYTERGGEIAFKVPPPEWIQTELVELAGAMPVWKESAQSGGWTVVNLEQIAVWNPDMVWVVNYRGSADQSVEALRADPRWQSLRAAQSNRIFAFPADYCSWDQPSPRWGLGLWWLAKTVHPDLFADVDLYGEIDRFYALYGLNAEAVRTRILPLIQENLNDPH